MTPLRRNKFCYHIFTKINSKSPITFDAPQYIFIEPTEIEDLLEFKVNNHDIYFTIDMSRNSVLEYLCFIIILIH